MQQDTKLPTMALQTPIRVRLRTSLSTRTIYINPPSNSSPSYSPLSSPLSSYQSLSASSSAPTTPSPMSTPTKTKRALQPKTPRFPGLSSSEAAILLGKYSTTEKFYTLVRKQNGCISKEKAEAIIPLVYKGMEVRYRCSEQAQIHAISETLRSVEAYVAFEELLATDWQFREWRGVTWVFDNALMLMQQEWNAHVVEERIPGLQERYEEGLERLAGEVGKAVMEWVALKGEFEKRFGGLEKEFGFGSVG